MAASKTFVNYKSDLLSFEVANEQFLGVIEPGRVRGFDTLFTPQPGLIFNILHDLTGIKKVRIDGNTESEPTGVVFSRQGTVAQFEEIVEDLAVNTNAGEAVPRVDVVYFQHSYQQTTASNLGLVGIEQGVPGAGEPALALPTQMIKIGTITMPAGADQVQAAYYEPVTTKGVGGANFALEETVIAWLTSQDIRRKNELWPFYSDIARFIPAIGFGTNGGDSQPAGLSLAVPTIQDAAPAAVTIGSFYGFLDGVICYFQGGTFNLETDGSNDKMVWFQRGTQNLQGNPDLPYDVVVEMISHIGNVPNSGAIGSFTKPAGYASGNMGIGVMAENTLSNTVLNVLNPTDNNNDFTILGAMGVNTTNGQVSINTTDIATNSSNIQGNANDIGDLQTDLLLVENQADNNEDDIDDLKNEVQAITKPRTNLDWYQGSGGQVTRDSFTLNNPSNQTAQVLIGWTGYCAENGGDPGLISGIFIILADGGAVARTQVQYTDSALGGRAGFSLTALVTIGPGQNAAIQMTAGSDYRGADMDCLSTYFACRVIG